MSFDRLREFDHFLLIPSELFGCESVYAAQNRNRVLFAQELNERRKRKISLPTRTLSSFFNHLFGFFVSHVVYYIHNS